MWLVWLLQYIAVWFKLASLDSRQTRCWVAEGRRWQVQFIQFGYGEVWPKSWGLISVTVLSIKCMFACFVPYFYYIVLSFLYLLVRPEAIACGADLSFAADVFFYLNARSPRCVSRSARNFSRWSVLGRILWCWSRILEGRPPKNFMCQKHAKFGLILDDFKVRRRISPKRMKILKIR